MLPLRLKQHFRMIRRRQNQLDPQPPTTALSGTTEVAQFAAAPEQFAAGPEQIAAAPERIAAAPER